jgi:serine/threonine protein kinase
MELPELTSHDFTPDLPNAPLAPDTVLQDRYRIVRQLGRGGMGAVYEAIDQRLGKTVALKETLSSEPSMRRQFEREARLLAGMQHPALPQVSDHFVEGSRAFLVMQFIGGQDLARIIAQQPGPFPRDQVIAWADQLLDALIYLHSRDRQVIHRDIKPHNLKLTGTGQIALLDFGLAKSQASDPSITASQAFFGYTRHYAPLEQIQDQRTDPRSDIYALGATLYHLLTGIKPPDAMVRAAAVVNSGPDPLLPADKIHKVVGPQIAAILNKAMAQKPEDRYVDASEFRQALRQMGRTRNVAIEVNANEGAGNRVQPAASTIHINDLKPARVSSPSEVNMALVGSEKRFGPAGATAVLAILLTVAAGILYGAQRWFPPVDGVNALPVNDAAALRQTAPARKPERPRSSDTMGFAVTKTRPTADANTEQQVGEKRNEADFSRSEKGQPDVSKAQTNAGRNAESHNTAARKNARTPGAPSIRLPDPDFRDNAPSPSPDPRTRTFGPSSEAPKFYRASDGTQIVKSSNGSTRNSDSRLRSSSDAPKFYRAPDGTYIVKFSDGSTRVVGPRPSYAQTRGSSR